MASYAPSSTEARFTAHELARALNANLVGPGDIPITHLDTLEDAKPGALTFVRSARYARELGATRASAALIAKPIADQVQGQSPCLLVVDDADLALIRALELFAPRRGDVLAGVHPSAVVHPRASVDPAAFVGPCCVVEEGARVGAGANLIAQVYVGAHASIGPHSVLHPGVRVLERCAIGAHCILHSGVVLGADGFGYRPSPAPKSMSEALVKVPHIGNVVLGDHVEIGANTCIDRAKFASTSVGDGTKIDNLVQVGHNCVIGRACLICGNCGLSGSVTLGDGVILGGGAGIGDNVRIGKGAKVAANSGVSHDVPDNAVYMGQPAGPAAEWRRTYAHLRRMGKKE